MQPNKITKIEKEKKNALNSMLTLISCQLFVVRLTKMMNVHGVLNIALDFVCNVQSEWGRSFASIICQ